MLRETPWAGSDFNHCRRVLAARCLGDALENRVVKQEMLAETLTHSLDCRALRTQLRAETEPRP